MTVRPALARHVRVAAVAMRRHIRLASLTSVLLAGCRDGSKSGEAAGRIADVPGTIATADQDQRALPAPNAVLSLGSAADTGVAGYRAVRDTASLHGGSLSGRIETTHPVSGDTAIAPTHDLGVCKPFTETTLPSSRGGVGNAVVWLVGVSTGPAVTAPRRASLILDRCRLNPRVQVIARRATLLVTSRDAMMSRLRFVDQAHATTVRAQVAFNDAGQVVPTSAVAAAPGLVEVRDDQHPWVRAWIAVAPHPFVTVSDEDGRYEFESVPPGVYTLVVWQERLGTQSRTVRVEPGIATKVVIAY